MLILLMIFVVIVGFQVGFLAAVLTFIVGGIILAGKTPNNLEEFKKHVITILQELWLKRNISYKKSHLDGELIATNPYELTSKIIDRLPKIKIANSFYEKPDISSPQNRKHWIEAAYQICEFGDGEDSPRIWASDAAVGGGNLELGLSLFPEIALLSRRSVQASSILSLKLELGLPLTGQDLLALFGPQLTNYGKSHIEPICDYVSIQIDALQKHENRDLLKEWSDDCAEVEFGYSLFNGHASYIHCKPPRGLSFELSKSAEPLAFRLIREAENVWREEKGIPKVGEGWVSETELYYALNVAFPDLEVEQHASGLTPTFGALFSRRR